MDNTEYSEGQLRTFTRWCNVHLSKCERLLVDTIEEFVDGINLIYLTSVLSKINIPKHNRNPIHKIQKIENLNIALTTIKNDGVKLVNIGAEDIFEKSLKLVLGLIWSLILHYQLSQFRDQSEEGDISVKNALKEFIRKKINLEGKIDDFTKSWNDGILLSRLVNTLAPNTIPEWREMVPNNALQNCEKAILTAEKYLGVPKLLLPEELVDPNIDEESVMTYVSSVAASKPIQELSIPYSDFEVDIRRSRTICITPQCPFNFKFSFKALNENDPEIKINLVSEFTGDTIEVPFTKIVEHIYSAQVSQKIVGKYNLNIVLYERSNSTSLTFIDKPDDEFIFLSLDTNSKIYTERINSFLLDLRGSCLKLDGIKLEGKGKCEFNLNQISLEQYIITAYFSLKGSYVFGLNLKSEVSDINKSVKVDVECYPHPENSVIFGDNPTVKTGFYSVIPFQIPFLSSHCLTKAINLEDVHSVDFKLATTNNRALPPPVIRINEKGQYEGHFNFPESELYICQPIATSRFKSSIDMLPLVFYPSEEKNLVVGVENTIVCFVKSSEKIVVDVLNKETSTEHINLPFKVVTHGSESWVVLKYVPFAKGTYHIKVSDASSASTYKAIAEPQLLNYKICGLGLLHKGVYQSQYCEFSIMFDSDFDFYISEPPVFIEIVDFHDKPVLKSNFNFILPNFGRGSFTAPDAGRYKLNIYYKSFPLPESGLTFETKKPLDYKIQVYGEEPSYRVWKLYNMVCYIPSIGGSNFNLNLAGTRDSESKIFQISENFYNLSLLAQKEGNNVFTVLRDKVQASNTPKNYSFTDFNFNKVYGEHYICNNQCLIELNVEIPDFGDELRYYPFDISDGTKIIVSCQDPDKNVLELEPHVTSGKIKEISFPYNPKKSGIHTFITKIFYKKNYIELLPKVVYFHPIEKGSINTKSFIFVKKLGDDDSFLIKRKGDDKECLFSIDNYLVDGIECYRIEYMFDNDGKYAIYQNGKKDNVVTSKKYKFKVINPLKEEPDMSKIILRNIDELKSNELTFNRKYTALVDAIHVSNYETCGDLITAGVQGTSNTIKTVPIKYLGNQLYEVVFAIESGKDSSLVLFWKSNPENQARFKIHASDNKTNKVRFFQFDYENLGIGSNLQLIIDAKYTASDIKAVRILDHQNVSYFVGTIEQRVQCLTIWNPDRDSYKVEVILDDGSRFEHILQNKKSKVYDVEDTPLGILPVIGCKWKFIFPLDIILTSLNACHLEQINFEDTFEYSAMMHCISSEFVHEVTATKYDNFRLVAEFAPQFVGPHILKFKAKNKRNDSIFTGVPIPFYVQQQPHMLTSEVREFKIKLETGEFLEIYSEQNDFCYVISQNDLVKVDDDIYKFEFVPSSVGINQFRIYENKKIYKPINVVVERDSLQYQLLQKVSLVGAHHLEEIKHYINCPINIIIDVKDLVGTQISLLPDSFRGILTGPDETKYNVVFVHNGGTIYETSIVCQLSGKYKLELFYGNLCFNVKSFEVSSENNPFITVLYNKDLVCEAGVPLSIPILRSTFSPIFAELCTDDGKISGEALVIPLYGPYSIITILTYSEGVNKLNFYSDDSVDKFYSLNVLCHPSMSKKHPNVITFGDKVVLNSRSITKHQSYIFSDTSSNFYCDFEVPEEANMIGNIVYPQESSKNDVKIQILDNKSYEIDYTPVEAGLNIINIVCFIEKFGRQLFPVVINVNEIEILKAGEIYEIRIIFNKSEKASVQIVNLDSNFTENPLIMWKSKKSKKILTFSHIPKNEGLYEIVVHLENEIVRYKFSVIGSVVFDDSIQQIVSFEDDIYSSIIPSGIPVYIPRTGVLEKYFDLKGLKVQLLHLDEFDNLISTSVINYQSVQQKYIVIQLPDTQGIYYLAILLNGEQVTQFYKIVTSNQVQSRLRIKVTDPSQCICNIPIHAVIDARLYKSRNISFQLLGPTVVYKKFLEVEPNIFMIIFVAENEGDYEIVVLFEGKEIHKSNIYVKPEGKDAIKYFANESVSKSISLALVNLKENEKLITDAKFIHNADYKHRVEYINETLFDNQATKSIPMHEVKGGRSEFEQKEHGKLEFNFTPQNRGLVIIYPSALLPDGRVIDYLPNSIFIRLKSLVVGKPSLISLCVEDIGDYDVIVQTKSGNTYKITDFDFFVRGGYVSAQFYYTPKEKGEAKVEIYRKGVLLVSEKFAFAKPLVNSLVYEAGMTCTIKYKTKYFVKSDVIEGRVVDDSKNLIKSEVAVKPGSGTIQINFKPLKEGLHKIRLVKNGVEMESSEKTIFLEKPETTKLTKKINIISGDSNDEKKVKYRIRRVGQSGTEPVFWAQDNEKSDESKIKLNPIFSLNSSGPFEVVKVKEKKVQPANNPIKK